MDLGEHGQLLVASCPYKKPLETPEFSTDAELAVVLLDTKGAVNAWALARGSKLTVGAKKLAVGKARDWIAG